jgi:antitoxin component of RelBE/YafQ-DinJ toxin-antitoxin module
MNQEPIRKDALINIRITSDEKRAAHQAAKQAGKPVSELVRDLLKNVKTTSQA